MENKRKKIRLISLIPLIIGTILIFFGIFSSIANCKRIEHPVTSYKVDVDTDIFNKSADVKVEIETEENISSQITVFINVDSYSVDLVKISDTIYKGVLHLNMGPNYHHIWAEDVIVKAYSNNGTEIDIQKYSLIDDTKTEIDFTLNFIPLIIGFVLVLFGSVSNAVLNKIPSFGSVIKSTTSTITESISRIKDAINNNDDYNSSSSTITNEPKETTITCPYCGSTIDKKENRCPNCSANIKR